MKWLDKAVTRRKASDDREKKEKTSSLNGSFLESSTDKLLQICNFKSPSNLYVKKTENKGFGVFSTQKIQENQIIECCYCISLEWGMKYHGDSSIRRYAYWTNECECRECKKNGPRGFIALGYGSIYNSANRINEANAEYKIDPLNKTLTFFSTKKIEANEEILTWWGQDYYDEWCK